MEAARLFSGIEDVELVIDGLLVGMVVHWFFSSLSKHWLWLGVSVYRAVYPLLNQVCISIFCEFYLPSQMSLRPVNNS